MNIKIAVALSLILTMFNAWGATEQSSLTCQGSAIRDAKKLLSFYRDNDDRISVDKKVTPLAKIKNPQNGMQKFDFLETWGYIYKGKYRMRFIYYSDVDCLLMGEEILEYANL